MRFHFLGILTFLSLFEVQSPTFVRSFGFLLPLNAKLLISLENILIIFVVVMEIFLKLNSEPSTFFAKKKSSDFAV